MQLTGKQIVEKGIITGVCEEGIQQQGVDVRIDRVFEVINFGNGTVPAKGKTTTPPTVEVAALDAHEDSKGYFYLPPGYYEVTFEEGCKIPANYAMQFKSRSSLVRCGAEIRSGQFDGGFETDKMGAFLKVELPIRIEKGARVAQAIINETYTVEKEYLYDGQWQGDKQRNS